MIFAETGYWRNFEFEKKGKQGKEKLGKWEIIKKGYRGKWILGKREIGKKSNL